MNSSSIKWLAAPSSLAFAWTLIFAAVDYESTVQTWWKGLVLQPSSGILCATTTTFFHANLVHLLSNITFVYMLAFTLRGVFRPTQFIVLWSIFSPLATLTSYLWDPSPLVGASAGLAAIMGGALRVSLGGETRSLKKWFTLVLMTMLVCWAPGDRVAHISGFCFGYLLGRWAITLRNGLSIAIGCTLGSTLYLLLIP